MSKLLPVVIEGHKFIQLSRLTIDQANDLRSWLPKNNLKKIKYQGVELSECIMFETYECWFRNNHVLSSTYETILDF